MKIINQKHFGIALMFFICLFSLISNVAFAYNTTLELIINTDKGDTYTYYTELSDRQLRNLQNNLMNEIRPFLIEAQKECAREMGYHEDIYGKDNYKMVIVTKYSIVIRDRSNGRVILSR